MPQEDPIQPAPSFALSLEGRILAHRRFLAELARLLPVDRQTDLIDWLDDHAIYQDGQEDPGAVPGDAVTLELARADEFRILKQQITGSS